MEAVGIMETSLDLSFAVGLKRLDNLPQIVKKLDESWGSDGRALVLNADRNVPESRPS